MSFQAMAAASRFRARNSTEKLLLYMLANYADEDGVAFPSQARLADDGSMSERTVRSSLAALEEQGVIRRETRKRADGTRTSDRITLLIEGLDGHRQCASQPPATCVDPPATGADLPADFAGEVPADFAGNPASLEPIREPESLSQPQNSQRRPNSRAWDTNPRAVDRVAAAIWRGAHPRSRQRSTEVALAAAVAAELLAGADPEDLLAAFAAYAADSETLAEDGKYAKGLHRLFEDGAWRSWLPAPKSRLEQAIERAAVMLSRVVTIDRVSRWRAGDDWDDPHSAPPDHPDCRYRDLVCAQPAEAFAAWRQRRAAGEREVLTGERSACVALVQRMHTLLQTWKTDPLGFIAAIGPLTEAWEVAWAASAPVRPPWAALVEEAA